jgi:hypothetical protein
MEETTTIEPRHKAALSDRAVGCKRIFAFGCLSILICFILFILLLIVKPPFFWSRTTDFLNKNTSVDTEKDYVDLTTAQDILESQIQAVGENKVELDEDILTVLARNSFENVPYLTVDLEKDSLKLIWIIDNSKDEYPLYGVAEIKKDSKNSLYIDKLGTPRVYLPKAIGKAIFTTIVSLLTIGDEKADQNSLIYQLLSANPTFDITEIEFADDKLILTIAVESQIYD